MGTIASDELFLPKFGIIIKNRDDLRIPLLLETIPTQKEFREAVKSMSPEQERFCKAYRSMQLESTVFGICALQIKPQLEKLLNLPDMSLTKEIHLQQDLMDLFLEYQIPSDLLSFPHHDKDNYNDEDRVMYVKQQTTAILEMIRSQKEQELLGKRQEAEYEKEIEMARREEVFWKKREQDREREKEKRKRDERERLKRKERKKQIRKKKSFKDKVSHLLPDFRFGNDNVEYDSFVPTAVDCVRIQCSDVKWSLPRELSS